ncbi:hypothetical protein FHS76_000862 [Ochrobactrum daejeonense]|uniref:DUF930 domain-containing protein n=1 Tax=Brucella daejeonensis TaxID=659015 RepID=A0A7W9AUU5_9HYPH|nr:DUF930 domain-containing protein [Brucella daejeonensis]MBB5701013.1 hypothetical protein [Brucella daejeonensis]NKB79667.1 DUF930 domain-containing protein [Brucella daejeonensis]
MRQFARRLTGETGWGVPASVGLHLMLALLLVVRLPALSAPSAEQSVNVEIVPQPAPKEQAKPKQPPAAAAPQAFESAAAKTETPKPERADLPPAAPETGKNKDETPPDPAPSAELPRPGKQSADNLLRADNGTDAAASKQKVPVPDQKPALQPAKPLSAQPAKRLTKAREIYSKDAMADPRVRQAIGKLPAKDRVIQLCGIEALEQVRRHQPGAFPDMLARTGGSVSDSGQTVSDGAYRSKGKWYAIDFTCKVDPATLAISSFSYSIGHPIPESQWNSRQLPRD